MVRIDSLAPNGFLNPPHERGWDVTDSIDDVGGAEGDEPATDGGIRLFQARPRAALGLPGQRHFESRGRVGRPGDGHPDEGRAIGHLLIRSDDDDRTDLLFAVACDSDADDLTVEVARGHRPSPPISVSRPRTRRWGAGRAGP